MLRLGAGETVLTGAQQIASLLGQFSISLLAFLFLQELKQTSHKLVESSVISTINSFYVIRVYEMHKN